MSPSREVSFVKTLVASYILTSFASYAQGQFIAAPKPFNQLVKDDAYNVLTRCSSWPPSLTTSAKDQAANKNLQDKTDALVNLLVQKVAPTQDPTVPPNQYNGS